jgi:hypothetical protein
MYLQCAHGGETLHPDDDDNSRRQHRWVARAQLRTHQNASHCLGTPAPQDQRTVHALPSDVYAGAWLEPRQRKSCRRQAHRGGGARNALARTSRSSYRNKNKANTASGATRAQSFGAGAQDTLAHLTTHAQTNTQAPAATATPASAKASRDVGSHNPRQSPSRTCSKCCSKIGGWRPRGQRWRLAGTNIQARFIVNKGQAACTPLSNQ